MNKKTKTIVLTGGGTAGHVIPNIALIPKLKQYFDKIIYIGSSNGIEKELVKDADVEYIEIPTVKLVRALKFENLLIPFKLFSSVRKTRKILNDIRPNIIFSKGGYVSVPVCLASKKVPIIMHESDLSMGLANKIIYPKCTLLCTNFEDTALKYKKAYYTSTPLRDLKKYSNTCELHLPKSKTLLIIGGSLGAKIINKTAFKIADKLCENMNVIHIVGKGNLPNIKLPSNYNVFEYCENMNEIYSHTNYAVSRAGANAITELRYLNIPMLLIPLSSGSRGDQIQNSKHFVHKGYAIELRQEELNEETLLKNIETLIKSSDRLKYNMSKTKLPDANKKIVELILKYCK